MTETKFRKPEHITLRECYLCIECIFRNNIDCMKAQKSKSDCAVLEKRKTNTIKEPIPTNTDFWRRNICDPNCPAYFLMNSEPACNANMMFFSKANVLCKILPKYKLVEV